MKITMSKDGRPRVNVRVQNRVDLDDIVNAICYEQRMQIEEGEVDQIHLTKRGVEKTLHDVLKFYGNDMPSYWRDDVPDDSADEVEEMVKAEVLRLFPALGVGR